jgi:hypothetical protein
VIGEWVSNFFSVLLWELKKLSHADTASPGRVHLMHPANKHIKNCHTSEQEKNSTNRTVKLDTYMASVQYQPKKKNNPRQ